MLCYMCPACPRPRRSQHRTIPGVFDPQPSNQRGYPGGARGAQCEAQEAAARVLRVRPRLHVQRQTLDVQADPLRPPRSQSNKTVISPPVLLAMRLVGLSFGLSVDQSCMQPANSFCHLSITGMTSTLAFIGLIIGFGYSWVLYLWLS